MSYKLYTAYRMPYDGTVSGMKNISSLLREDITEILYQELLEERIRGAVKLYDMETLVSAVPERFGNLEFPKTYKADYSAWFNEMIEHRGANQKEEPPTPSVFLFVDDETPQWLYLIPANIPENVLTEILSTDKYNAEDYAYWNNSDRPDSISEEDFKERKTTWGRIGVWDKSLGECGWQVNIIPGYMLRGMVWDSDPEDANGLFPTFEKRVNSVVRAALFAELRAEVRKQYPSQEDATKEEKDSMLQDVWRAYLDSAHMIMDKDPRAVALAEEVVPFLVKDLTMEHLREGD